MFLFLETIAFWLHNSRLAENSPIVLNYGATLFMSNFLLSSHHLISCQPPETFITNSYIVPKFYRWSQNDTHPLERMEQDSVCLWFLMWLQWHCLRFLHPFTHNIYYSYLYYPRLVWSANQNIPVGANANFQWRQNRGLFLGVGNLTENILPRCIPTIQQVLLV